MRDLYNPTPQDPHGAARTIHNFDILFTSAAGEQRTMNLLPGLAKARCPVLVMVGEEDPVCGQVERVADIARRGGRAVVMMAEGEAGRVDRTAAEMQIGRRLPEPCCERRVGNAAEDGHPDGATEGSGEHVGAGDHAPAVPPDD